MEPSRRLAYLDALGIQGYVRRVLPETEKKGTAPNSLLENRGLSPFLPETGVEVEDLPRPSSATEMGWEALQQQVADCQRCPELVQNRSRTVFGVGDRQAQWMVIGEAPGVDEDRQGEPFVGRAGQLLNAMLAAIGLKREQVFIANILKCRPPGNRDPSSEEAAHCEAFLLRQIELVQPRILLSVGRISAQNLLHSDAPVGKLRGRVHRFGQQQIPLVVTYHPAYLLRSPEQKASAWQDLQLALRTWQGR